MSRRVAGRGPGFASCEARCCSLGMAWVASGSRLDVGMARAWLVVVTASVDRYM